MTQRDKWKKREVVNRYYAYKDLLNLKANLCQYTPEDKLRIEFYLRMPKSWSKKKRKQYLGKPHQQKPDIDNLVKAFLDCLLDDDSFVWDIKAAKYWAKEGRIIIQQKIN